jgi:hypothetical protein
MNWYSTQPRHLTNEQRMLLREVALTYRRARWAGKHQNEAVAAIAEYRRLSPFATGDKLSLCEDSLQAKLVVSGEVNRMIAAAINVNPEWFWHGPGA